MRQDERLIRNLLLLYVCMLCFVQMRTGLVLEVIWTVIAMIGAFIIFITVLAFAISCLITFVICIFFLKLILQSVIKELNEKEEEEQE